MIELSDQPIDVPQITDSVRDTRAGAVVLFLGTVRELTGDVRTSRLEYEAYEAMAISELQRLETEARNRWSLSGVTVVHRTGSLDPGDVAVAVAVSSAHRREAFEAGQWLIDTLKEVVPIWKQENWADGSSEWVHPGLSANESP